MDQVPNSFMERFCDTVEELGFKGKFSIVPMPGGRGDIVNGIPGFEKAEIDEWLWMVRKRLAGYFLFVRRFLVLFSPMLSSIWRKTLDCFGGGRQESGGCTGNCGVLFLAALREVVKRVEMLLGDRVEWMSFEEIMRLVLA